MGRPQTHPNSLANLRLGPKNRKSRPIEERFWSKVLQGPPPAHRPELGPCWEWTAARNPAGYGVFGTDAGRVSLAHRIAWEMTFGPVPAGTGVLHHCDNPPCVRVEHLFLGSPADNMSDAKRKGRARGHSKITEVEVLDIRRRAAAGETATSIAPSVGLSRSAVVFIIQRKRWARIPEAAL